MGDFVSYGQMLLPMLYHLADVIAFINVVVVGKTLHHLCDLLIADVIAKWQDETATFLYSKVGRCYCHVAGWKSHICTEFGRCYCQVADVIATVYLCDGRCYSQVTDGITTQGGSCCLVHVITKLADRIAIGSVYSLC